MKALRGFCQVVGWVFVVLWILGTINVIDVTVRIMPHTVSIKTEVSE